MLDQLNLREFEEQFQIRSKPTLSNVTKILKKKVVSLSILDANRARNAMIIQRRVALPAPDIARSVEETDLAKLPGLLRLVNWGEGVVTRETSCCPLLRFEM